MSSSLWVARFSGNPFFVKEIDKKATDKNLIITLVKSNNNITSGEL